MDPINIIKIIAIMGDIHWTFTMCHTCITCSAMCYLIWLLMLNCPGLSPWSSPLLCLYPSWWYHMSAICHQLPTSPDLQTPKLQTHISTASTWMSNRSHKFNMSQTHSWSLCKNCPTFFLPPLMATATFQLLRPKSLEPSKCSSFSHIPYPMHYKGHPVVSVFKIHPEFSHFPSLSFCYSSPNHDHLFLR